MRANTTSPGLKTISPPRKPTTESAQQSTARGATAMTASHFGHLVGRRPDLRFSDGPGCGKAPRRSARRPAPLLRSAARSRPCGPDPGGARSGSRVRGRRLRAAAPTRVIGQGRFSPVSRPASLLFCPWDGQTGIGPPRLPGRAGGVHPRLLPFHRSTAFPKLRAGAASPAGRRPARRVLADGAVGSAFLLLSPRSRIRSGSGSGRARTGSPSASACSTG